MARCHWTQISSLFGFGDDITWGKRSALSNDGTSKTAVMWPKTSINIGFDRSAIQISDSDIDAVKLIHKPNNILNRAHSTCLESKPDQSPENNYFGLPGFQDIPDYTGNDHYENNLLEASVEVGEAPCLSQEFDYYQD